MSNSPSPRKITERYIDAIWGPIDVIGKAVTGDAWPMLYEAVREAIGLSLILKIPSLIGYFILGKEYSGFDTCLQESILRVDCYACFVIVGSDFLLWTLIAGKAIGRFIAGMQALKLKQKSKANTRKGGASASR